MRSIAVKTREPAIGILLVLVSTVAFAVGPTAARVAFDNGSNTLTVVTLRGIVGSALMALLILTSGQGFVIDRRAWRWCLHGGVYYALTVYGFLGAVADIPVNVAVLIFFTHPLLLAAIAHWRGEDRLTARKLMLAFAIVAGLALVLGQGLGKLEPTGIALAVLASAAMCGMILSGARAQHHATSTQVNFCVTALSTIVFAVLATIMGAWALPVNSAGWAGVAGAGAGIGIGLLSFFAALRYLSPVRAAMLSNVEPLLAILFAAVILGERLEPLRWLGMALVVGGLVLFESADRSRAAGGGSKGVEP